MRLFPFADCQARCTLPGYRIIHGIASSTIVCIVESAYRAVMVEQDDPILWLLAAMQGAGGVKSAFTRTRR